MSLKLTLNDIKNIISESINKILNEDVYIDKKLNNKKLNLIYNTNNTINKNNLTSQDMLKTDKMDANNSDVYIIPLKGGFKSYNITDIKGTEVMHYFKRLWDNQKTFIKHSKNEYELNMLKQDETKFLNRFVTKIEIILSDYIKNNVNKDEEINSISIFPIKSSSNFNKQMANLLSNMSVLNLPIKVIDENLLLKDLRNLKKDDDFIQKNRDFYKSKFYKKLSDDNSTIEQHTDTMINKFNTIKKIQEKIPELNDLSNKILTIYYHRNNLTPKRELQLVNLYKNYFDLLKLISKTIYFNNIKNTNSKIQLSSIMTPIKSSKPIQIEERSKFIWGLVKNYLKNEKSTITQNSYESVNICTWQPVKFEIKKLPNSIRMGISNIYNPSDDKEFLNKELEKTHNSLFVIFDDNISGGATLSDVCIQCRNLGITNIIPITFGKMRESNSQGVLQLSTPENGFNLI